MRVGSHRHDACAACLPERADAFQRFRIRFLDGCRDDRPALVERRSGSPRARGRCAGNGMRRDKIRDAIAECGERGRDDILFGAARIGHDRAPPDRRGNGGKQRRALRDRRRHQHHVGVVQFARPVLIEAARAIDDSEAQGVFEIRSRPAHADDRPDHARAS
jgi:hypothetical protein